MKTVNTNMTTVPSPFHVVNRPQHVALLYRRTPLLLLQQKRPNLSPTPLDLIHLIQKAQEFSALFHLA